MDEPKPTQPDGGSQSPHASGSAIDIMSPKPLELPKAVAQTQHVSESTPSPAPDPVVAPVAEEPKKSIDLNAIKPTVAQKPPKAPGGGGTGLAIIATVVIVLGLGVLMVYAYLRTKGISII